MLIKQILLGDAMLAGRGEACKPAWESDQLDSPRPPEIEPAYFDEALDAWVLSRHMDVLAAFHSSELAAIGPNNKGITAPPAEDSRLKMRTETMEALSPRQLRAWREKLEPEVDALVTSLPSEQPVDLIGEYARPVCLTLAAMVTCIPMQDAANLQDRAQEVSAASAEPYDAALRSRAKSASAELRECFHSGPEALRDSGFVALSQTMPSILGNAWFALSQHPEEWLSMHRQPDLTERGIEELLRYAGLPRLLLRRATSDVNLNGVLICKGERVMLRVIAANNDPERFPHPNQVDVRRQGVRHFTLGAGSHQCVGNGLIRMAAVTITRPLLKRFGRASLVQDVEWQGGSGFRAPRSLWVRLGEG
jgi:cytochrome P450